MNKFKDVDSYISGCPKEYQEKLNQLRAAIKKAAPGAEEKFSYGMPYYAYKGRVVYFGLAKHHVGLYIPPPIIANHHQELKEYKTSVSAIQFPLDKELPLNLITKLIKARIKHNESEKK